MTKPSKAQQKKWDSDVILALLLEKYFTGLKYENIPKTPSVTKTLDDLEVDIRKRKEEITIKKKTKKENDELL